MYIRTDGTLHPQELRKQHAGKGKMKGSSPTSGTAPPRQHRRQLPGDEFLPGKTEPPTGLPGHPTDQSFSLGNFIRANDLNNVKACIQHGARLDLPALPGDDLPLTLAILMRSPEGDAMADFMLQKEPNCADYRFGKSESALFASFFSRNTEMVKKLLDCGANPFLPEFDGLDSLFDFLARLDRIDELPMDSRKMLDVLQDWRVRHPSMFQTRLAGFGEDTNDSASEDEFERTPT